ncbi:hypothetical protein Tco_0746779, partial [Tanacetum coccineum]
QEDSATGGGQKAKTKVVTGVRIIVDETVLDHKPNGATERFVISSDSSHHSSTNASGAEGDSIIRSAIIPPVMIEAMVISHAVSAHSVLETGTKVTTLVHASMFHDSDSTEMVKADAASPSYSAKQDLSMGSRELNAETLHQIREMDYHHLFTEFNVGTARQACLNTKVRMRIEYCLSERKRLEFECEKEADLLKARDEEIKNLKAQLLVKETEATEAARFRNLKLKDLNVDVSSLRSQKDSLVDQVHALEATCSGLRDQVSRYERLKEQIEEFQDAQMNIVNDKVAKLDADLLEMALHLEEKFYPHLITTISGRRWLLTHGLKLAVVKCLNSQEYLSALGAAISRAIEKGMQEGLSVEADYNSALQRLREVEFPLLAQLKSHKDASNEDVMNLLCLEGPLADAHGMSDLQPDLEQLTLPIYCLEDQVVLGETSLSFALSVTYSRVERIGENVAARRVPATVVTMTALSTTFVAASSVPPITIEDYEIVGTDGPEDAQGNGQGNVASFPAVEFEKEELDTTPKRDPPS